MVAGVAAVAARVDLGRAGVTRSASRRSKRDVMGDKGSRELRVGGQARHEEKYVGRQILSMPIGSLARCLSCKQKAIRASAVLLRIRNLAFCAKVKRQNSWYPALLLHIQG